MIAGNNNTDAAYVVAVHALPDPGEDFNDYTWRLMNSGDSRLAAIALRLHKKKFLQEFLFFLRCLPGFSFTTFEFGANVRVAMQLPTF